VIHRHAEILADNGFAAFIALQSTPPVDFYNSRARLIIHGGKIQAQRGDVWVIPGGYSEYVAALAAAEVKKLMFCQGHYNLPFTGDPRSGFAEFDVDGVIATSETVRSFFRDVYGLSNAPLIPCAIDPKIFAPASAKERQISLMPQKLPEEAAFIEATFRRRHRRYADVPWVPISDKTQREAAAMMAKSGVFLTLSYKEGFGLPPLEAMACGCLVAGFESDGGREYMTSDNGWWAKPGDWKACIDGLAAALDLIEERGPGLAARHEAMAATVQRYSPARMEAALLGFWREELDKPFP
jgi:glycosyltransferase involved in cell wall biosynthesis